MRRVALIYDARLTYDLKIMTGVAAYMHEVESFNVYIEENALKDQRLPDLRSWKGDGIIANFDHPNVPRAVAKSRLPVVGFGGGYGWYTRRSSVPYFFSNNKAVARLAAEHLLTRGFRNFAYCGYAKTPINGWSEERGMAFAALVGKNGYSCNIFRDHYRTNKHWVSVQRSLGEWLRTLTKPVGIMAANDNRARHVLEACRAFNLEVPNEVAIIGVDNDELLCQLGSPPLTSIEQGVKRIGYEAAALLSQMMRGRKPRRRHFILEPLGVVTRQSTDVLAIADQTVKTALTFIQERATFGIKVSDVVATVAVSRSKLETHFSRALGHSVHSAIRKVQLERARRLISNTNMPLKQIAADVGFRSVQHMTALFGRAFGKPPGAYRKSVTLS